MAVKVLTKTNVIAAVIVAIGAYAGLHLIPLIPFPWVRR